MPERAPQSYAELIQDYGDPTPFIRRDGSVRPEWEDAILSPIRLPLPLPLSWDLTRTAGWIRAHKSIAGQLEALFHSISINGDWIHIHDFMGVYCFRTQRGGHRLSMHSWALAIDLNAIRCPLGGDPSRQSRLLVSHFEDAGWTWGGRWSRPDPMHFQWAGENL